MGKEIDIINPIISKKTLKSRRYYNKHKNRLLVEGRKRCKNWYQSHREYALKKCKVRYQKYKTEIKEQHKDYVKRNKEKIAKYHHNYNMKNKDKIKKYQRLWRMNLSPERREMIRIRGNIANMKWKRNHPNRTDAKYLLWKQIILYYAGNPPKCQCCGFDGGIIFLTIDHVNNNGNIERKQIGFITMLKKIVKLGYPSDYQILCFNCNHAKHLNGGICPHQQQRGDSH